MKFVNKFFKIFGTGIKNATIVFASFFIPIFILVALTSEQGISLLWSLDNYIRALSHPLIIGLYVMLILLSTVNSYKKLEQ